MMCDSVLVERHGRRVDASRDTGTVWRPSPGKRGAFLLERLVASSGRGIRVRRLGGNRAGEIRLTRFLRNEAVTPAAMVAEASARLAERCRGRPVLAIQDTTVVRSAGGGGLYLHACIAIDEADGALLGLAQAAFLGRTQGGKASYRERAFPDRESYRWLEGARAAASACAAASHLTIVADREADIYAVFAQRPAGAQMIVRAGGWDRALDNGQLLSQALDTAPEAGRLAIDLPAGPGRRARTATLAQRFMPVVVKRPRRGADTDLPESLALYAVDVRECDAPDGLEPVHWRLLTTLPVETPEQAFGIVDRYRRRWTIEQVFRTLKTQGFDIESLAIGDEPALRNLVTAALVAATLVQQLVHARDGGEQPLRPILDVFPPEDIAVIEAVSASLEGKTERQKNPHPKGSLAFASWVCARLGGWTGYYGKAGPIVMLEGWFELQSIKRGYALLDKHHNV